jgi:hypothetical protein
MSKNTNLSFLTDYITADITNGRIGINNASPTVAFDVVGVAKFSSTLTAGGSVGIGTTSPDALLTVAGANQATGAAFNTYGNALIYSTDSFAINKGGALSLGGKYNSAGTPIATFARIHGKKENATVDSTSGYLSFETVPEATATLTERMRITSNGNVAIGTNSPTSITGYTSLSVNNATNGGIVDLMVNNIVQGRFFTNATTYVGIGSVSNVPLVLNTNDTERMRITSGGNVQIGGTTATDAKLFVKGSSTTSSNFAILLYNSTPTDLFFVRNDGLTNFGVVTNSPYNYNVTYSPRTAGLDASGGFGYITSTRESKGNIKTIQNIDFINQLNPVSFNYRKKDSDKNKFIDELYEDVYYGFIADEVEKVDKNLVFYDDLKDGNKKLSGVHYNSMIAILTKAIQELKAEIETLKQK